MIEAKRLLLAITKIIYILMGCDHFRNHIFIRTIRHREKPRIVTFSIIPDISNENTKKEVLSPMYTISVRKIKNILPSILSKPQSEGVLRTDSHTLRGAEIRKQKLILKANPLQR